MSESAISPSVDMIRWTFSVDPAHRAVVETHLVDLGLDVTVLGEGQFHVIWEEPEADRDEVASELWEIAGEPFDITQEEFHRVSHVLIHPDVDDSTQAA